MKGSHIPQGFGDNLKTVCKDPVKNFADSDSFWGFDPCKISVFVV